MFKSITVDKNRIPVGLMGIACIVILFLMTTGDGEIRETELWYLQMLLLCITGYYVYTKYWDILNEKMEFLAYMRMCLLHVFLPASLFSVLTTVIAFICGENVSADELGKKMLLIFTRDSNEIKNWVFGVVVYGMIALYFIRILAYRFNTALFLLIVVICQILSVEETKVRLSEDIGVLQAVEAFFLGVVLAKLLKKKFFQQKELVMISGGVATLLILIYTFTAGNAFWSKMGIFLWIWIFFLINVSFNGRVIKRIVANRIFVLLGKNIVWIIGVYFVIWQILNNNVQSIGVKFLFATGAIVGGIVLGELTECSQAKISQFYLDGNGYCVLKGWCLSPIRSVEILSGTQLIGEAAVGIPRRDLEKKYGEKNLGFQWRGKSNGEPIWIKICYENHIKKRMKLG